MSPNGCCDIIFDSILRDGVGNTFGGLIAKKHLIGATEVAMIGRCTAGHHPALWSQSPLAALMSLSAGELTWS